MFESLSAGSEIVTYIKTPDVLIITQIKMGRKKLSTGEARRIAKIRHSKSSFKERQAHSLVMNRARWAKQKPPSGGSAPIIK